MAGPQDFMVGNAPAPASYASGLMDFAAIGKLGDEYIKGRMANAFPNGIPKLADGSPNYNEILNTIAQTGGTQSVAAIMPYIYYAGLVQPGGTNPLVDKIRGGGGGGGGGGGAAPPTEEASAPRAEAGQNHPAAASPSNIVQRNEPPQKEMPHVSGDGTPQSPHVIPPSSSAYEHYKESQYFPNGSTYEITIKGNTFRGVKGGPPPRKVEPGEAPVYPDAEKPFEVAPRPGETPQETNKRALRERMSTTPPAAETATPQVVPRPGEQGIGTGGAAVPRSGVLPQGAAPIVQQPTPTASGRAPLQLIDPVTNNPEIKRLEAQRDDLLATAAAAAARQSPMRENPIIKMQIEEANKKADSIQKRIDTKSAELYKSVDEVNKYRGMGFASPSEGKAWEAAQGETIKTGSAINEAIQGAATQVSADLMQDIEQGQRLMDSPGLFTGFGAHQYLDFQKAKASLGGSPAAAAKMEAFEKTSSKLALGLVNMEQFLKAMGGQKATRTFASQIHLVAASSPDLSHTLAGNRILYETAKRSGQRFQEIQRMANTYLKSNPTLDSTFQQQVADYLQKNPLLTPEEASDPNGPEQFLGAPEVPKGLKGTALEKWISDMKFTEGDDLVRSNGKYYHVLQHRKTGAPVQIQVPQ